MLNDHHNRHPDQANPFLACTWQLLVAGNYLGLRMLLKIYVGDISLTQHDESSATTSLQSHHHTWTLLLIDEVVQAGLL